VCTGEHCMHWNLKSPGPAGYQGVHRGTLHALDDKQGPTLPPPPGFPALPPRVPTLPIMKLNLNLNLNFELELETKFKFTPRVPNPPPRVPTLTLPPRVPTLPTLKLNSTQYANSKPISILPTRVPTLPNLNFKLKNKLKTPIQISN
jgi:hypothetical protein